MRVSDFQFARYFLQEEIDLRPELVQAILDKEIEMRMDGEADQVVLRSDKIIYSNPSSVTRVLFNLLYSILSAHVGSAVHRDKLGLGLLYMCKKYVYSDYDPKEFNGPPVLLDFDKLSIPAFIVHDLVEPLVGKTKPHAVLFMNCNFTDSCRIIDRFEVLQDQYNLPKQAINYNDFPLLLSNCKIHNSAAELAHITVKYLELSFGEKSHSIIRNLLLDRSGHLMGHIVLVLKTLNGEPDFVIKFLRYLESNVSMTSEERKLSEEIQVKRVASDEYLNANLKIAGDGARSPQTFKQWSQWSMLMGLVEKQLSPMRGSMWPTTENVKPHEDALRALLREEASKKNKNQLNFEEMLEVARDVYDHNAVEPGKLTEYMIRNHRVWKI